MGQYIKMNAIPIIMLGSIKTQLVRQEEQWKKKLETIDSESGPNQRNTETAELGTFSWYQAVLENREAIKEKLVEARREVEDALTRLRDGTFGICERCGSRIEEARLKLMPTTTLCVTCK